MEELILEEARSFYSEEEELILEEEALCLNREMLTEVKNLIDDINDIKPPNHLKQFIHPQWGSILGSEENIRLAVLQDEVELCEQRVENGSDSIPHLGYMLFALKARIKELSPNKPSPKTQVDEGNYEYMPKEPLGEWTKIREHERMVNYVDESSLH